MWSRTSSSNFQYPVFTLRSPANCLRLLPHLPVTYILSFNSMFQKAVPTQDVTNPVNLPSFYCFKIFLSSLILCYTLCFSHWKSKRASQSFSTTTFPGISEKYFPKFPRFITTLNYAPNIAVYYFPPLIFKSNLLVKRAFILLNATFTVAMLIFIRPLG